MSRIKDMLKNGDTKLENWNVLTTKAQIVNVIEASERRPQLIYKHSHTCGICLVTKEDLENNFGRISEKAAMNFVNVIKERAVSNAIAEKLDVRHESPQVLVVKNGTCFWNESHYSIKADEIIDVLNENKLAV